MADFVSITPPEVGDPTELDAFAEPVLDNQNELIARVLGQGDNSGIPNGSFELGSDPDTAPAGWSLNIAAGNSTAFETDTAGTRHGRQSFSMTSPGSVTGGVTLTSDSFLLCAEGVAFKLQWLMKSSAVDITNAVKVRWYDQDEVLISTDTLYSEAAANPTSWEMQGATCTPPAGAKLYKIVVEGVNSTTGGTVYWDGFSLAEANGEEVFTADGTFIAKKTGFHTIDMWGGGGGGGSGAAYSGGGGTLFSHNGSDGQASYFGDSAVEARGGGAGLGASQGGGGDLSGGPATAAVAPSIAANLRKAGKTPSWGGSPGSASASGSGGTNLYQVTYLGVIGGYGGAGGADGSNNPGTAGTAGGANTAAGGGGGGGAGLAGDSAGGGASGQHGEYTRARVFLFAGHSYTVQVGDGGTGAATATGGASTPGANGGAGGNGGSGLVVVTW